MSFVSQNITKPGRYLGIEPNRIVKEPGARDIRFALCYPDIYEIGMSYFGLTLLYETINGIEGVWCERCFAPWPDMEAHLRATKTELFTLESRTPLSRMDVLGFSLGYELNVTNVLNMLSLAGIPIRANERRGLPIVIGGGPLMLNPTPFEAFFDLIVVGEAEEVIVEVVQRLKALRGESRDNIIAELSNIDGVYSPLLGRKPLKRLFVEDLNAAYHPVAPLIPLVGAVHDRLNIEISRGCGNGCRFCVAGYGYRPYRERSLEVLQPIIDRALRETGFQELSFLSLSSGDHSCLAPLIEYMRRRHPRVAVSLPSLKIGSITEEIINLLAEGARGGFTFALEASTADLRDRINKDIEVEALLRIMPLLKKHGWRKVKLYFMVGFPWEREDDFLSVKDLTRSIARHGIEVNLSVSPFTPKPHTPFQWLPMDDEETLRHKVFHVKHIAAGRGVKVNFRDIKTSIVEGLLSRGDERLTPLLEDLHGNNVRLEAWKENFAPDLYEAWLAGLDGLKESLLGPRSVTADLPWDFIDTGVNKSFLLTELDKAQGKEKTADCYNLCMGCGIGCGSNRGAAARGRASAEPSDVAYDLTVPHPSEGREPEYTVFTIRYAKSGEARLIGHLDTVDILLRALRSAGISLRMHGKYHAKPRISLSPALPVGIESACEMLQIDAEELTEITLSMLEQINIHLPRGMKILGVLPGKMDNPELEQWYLLVGKNGAYDGLTKVREARNRVFYLWKGKNVKELWLSGEFERIIKILNRRIDGFRVDHKHHI
jgi:radical SAM superfamily enzyme YgiQ (UPF0313 family)